MTSTMVNRMGKKKRERKGKKAHQLARQETLKRGREALLEGANEPLGYPRLRVRLSCEGVAVQQHTIFCLFA